MTQRLDPDIKAIRAIERAVAPLDDHAFKRDLEWVLAHRYGFPAFYLPAFLESFSGFGGGLRRKRERTRG